MNNSNIFGYTLFVFGLGIVAGLLIAPRSGEKTRELIKEQMQKCCSKTCGLIMEKSAEIKKQAEKYEEILRDMEEAES